MSHSLSVGQAVLDVIAEVGGCVSMAKLSSVLGLDPLLLKDVARALDLRGSVRCTSVGGIQVLTARLHHHFEPSGIEAQPTQSALRVGNLRAEYYRCFSRHLEPETFGINTRQGILDQVTLRFQVVDEERRKLIDWMEWRRGRIATLESKTYPQWGTIDFHQRGLMEDSGKLEALTAEHLALGQHLQLLDEEISCLQELRNKAKDLALYRDPKSESGRTYVVLDIGQRVQSLVSVLEVCRSAYRYGKQSWRLSLWGEESERQLLETFLREAVAIACVDERSGLAEARVLTFA